MCLLDRRRTGTCHSAKSCRSIHVRRPTSTDVTDIDIRQYRTSLSLHVGFGPGTAQGGWGVEGRECSLPATIGSDKTSFEEWIVCVGPVGLSTRG